MSEVWSKIHRWVGWIFLLVFLATGQYMRFHNPPMISLGNDIRLLLRSNHIYLLAASLLNLVVGYGNRSQRRLRLLRTLASVLLLLSPILLLYGFFLESDSGDMERPIAHLGVYAAFAGSLLFVVTKRSE